MPNGSNILFSWIGKADLSGASAKEINGPLISILRELDFKEVHLAYNYQPEEVADFLEAISKIYTGIVNPHFAKLTSPINFAEIYQITDSVLKQITDKSPEDKLNIQITSGTPAMSAVSILMGKAKYPAEFIQSSIEQGVQKVDLPFDITADFIPALAKRRDSQISALLSRNAPNTAAFEHIITQNSKMKALKQKAAIVAARNVPVLINGETGTGKELFATAIRNTSDRKNAPLLTLNCGAIPKDLIDTTLFGHVKGAFTGANERRVGYFEQADGGTLFLDELGELPLESQVRLLRVLQDGKITPVGSATEKKVDVRIIAATHRNLIEEVASGNFREDLFYRLAVGIINLPPLRERSGDIHLLADFILKKINLEASSQPDYIHKNISKDAIKFISSYSWPGNVRELEATLLRASIWCFDEQLDREHIEEALIVKTKKDNNHINIDISEGVDINKVIVDFRMQYIKQALAFTNGNKKQASKLLGLKNYQTLNNWLEKYDSN